MLLYSQLSNVDVIRLSEPQVTKLLAWRDANEVNKERIRTFHPVLNEGLIEVGITSIHFRENNDMTITYNYYFNKKHFANFVFHRLTLQVKNVYIDQKVDPKIISHFMKLANDRNFIVPLVQDVITIHATLMSYMFYFKQDISQREVKLKELPKHARRHLQRTKTPDELKVILRPHKIEYVLPDADKLSTKPLTTRQISAVSWSVRGHIRRYKSGKTVMVKPYVKGKDRPQKKKVYSISG